MNGHKYRNECIYRSHAMYSHIDSIHNIIIIMHKKPHVKTNWRMSSLLDYMSTA